MKTALAALVLTLVASNSFAGELPVSAKPSAQQIAKVKAAVQSQLSKDLRLAVSSDYGNNCGAEGDIIVFQVEVRKGHRTFDEKTGQVGATTSWEAVEGLRYFVMAEDAMQGDFNSNLITGPSSVCIE
jgi:hypothetical protein